jgi:hypothetical protein
MPLSNRQEREAFLEEFFKFPRHDIWDEPWLDYFKEEGAPCLIPFWRGSDTHPPQWELNVWFLAPNATAFRQLQDECKAFLGKSYALKRETKPNAFLRKRDCAEILHGSINLGNEEQAAPFTGFLHTWLTVWRERAQDYKPNTGQGETGAQLRELRRVFEQCLTTRDRSGAQGALRALEEAGLLERTNLLFLRIRLLAIFQEWEAITEDDNFTDLMEIRRTDPVTEAMLQSLYHTRLAEHASDLPVLFERFKAVHAEYRPLFRARGGLHSTEVLRLFQLRAVALEEPQPEEATKLLAEPSLSSEERTYLKSLADHAGVKTTLPAVAAPTPAPLKKAKEAIQNGQDDAALALITKAAPSTEKVATLLSYGRESGSLLAQTLTLQSLVELKPKDRSKVLAMPSLQRELSRLVTGGSKSPTPRKAPTPPPAPAPAPPARPKKTPLQAPPPVIEEEVVIPTIPQDWAAWLQAIQESRFGTEALYGMAESGTVLWNVSQTATNPVQARGFADSLSTLRDHGTPDAKRLFFDCLPLLIRAFTNNDSGFPRPEASPIYQSLRQTVAYDFQDIRFDHNTIALFYDLLVASLATGAATGYAETLEEVASFWEKDAPIHAHSLLDLLDALQDYPTHDQAARQQLATKAFSTVSEWQQRGRVDHRILLYAQRLAAEYQLAEMLPIPPDPTEETVDTQVVNWELLDGKRVAVYTLMESASPRVRKLIQEKCPTCQVATNAEKAGSETLKQFALAADILIIVTGCAKHAATEFLERWLPTGRPLLRPEGRGSSSVLTALESHLRSL